MYGASLYSFPKSGFLPGPRFGGLGIMSVFAMISIPRETNAAIRTPHVYPIRPWNRWFNIRGKTMPPIGQPVKT